MYSSMIFPYIFYLSDNRDITLNFIDLPHVVMKFVLWICILKQNSVQTRFNPVLSTGSGSESKTDLTHVASSFSVQAHGYKPVGRSARFACAKG